MSHDGQVIERGSAHDQEHNNAVMLVEFLENKLNNTTKPEKEVNMFDALAARLPGKENHHG